MEKPIFNRELDTYFDSSVFADLESKNINKLINTLKRVSLLPFGHSKIYFNSDIWDFTEYRNTNVGKLKRVFNFNEEMCPEIFKDKIKVYVLIKIVEDKLKIQSIYDVAYKVMNFMRYVENFGIYEVEDITAEVITNFLEDKNRTVAVKTIRKYRWAIKDFYEIYSIHFKNIRTAKIDEALKNDDIGKVKAAAKQNKSDSIPKGYFNKFVHECMNVALDTEVNDSLRGVACIYLILSQTGLRIGECLNLRVNSLREIKVLDDQKMHYLFYRTWKRVRRNEGVSQAYTYVNEITITAYNTLMELESYKKRRKALGVDFLYLGGTNMNSTSHFPLDSESFRRQVYRFFPYINSVFPTINLPDNYYPGIKNKDVERYMYGKNEHVKTIAMPDTRQFRVHVCIELSQKGVHPKYIQKFMGHLSSEMTAHYATPKETLSSQQKEVETAKETFESILKDKEKLIGKDTTKFIEEIQTFIKENNFNVVKDLDEIIKSLADKYAIKQKSGGYYVAPIRIRKTSEDIMSEIYYENDNFHDNLFSFYYMADVTYRQTKELAKVVQYNSSMGFNEVAESELKKLQRTISELLEPELEELKNKIDELGINIILQEHPNLLEIIENFNQIEREISIWKTIKI